MLLIRCIFHDINYLKGDNYEKNKEEVANRFYRKLSKYSFNNMPLKFVGYCLPFISFLNQRFTRLIDFTDATFYDGVNFSHATFSIVSFDSAKFSETAIFYSATFSVVSFESAMFLGKCNFLATNFKGVNFSEAGFSKEANFIRCNFVDEAEFPATTFCSRADIVMTTRHNS